MTPLKSFAKKLGIILLSAVGCLIVADLVGVAGSFLCDAFLNSWYVSGALFYTIWFVDGVFCGLIHYSLCANIADPKKKGELMEWKDHGQAGIITILTTAAILGALAFFFYRHDWRYSRADSVYVPDSESLTLTFFITIVASMIFFHHAMGPIDKKSASVPAKKKK